MCIFSRTWECVTLESCFAAPLPKGVPLNHSSMRSCAQKHLCEPQTWLCSSRPDFHAALHPLTVLAVQIFKWLEVLLKWGL